MAKIRRMLLKDMPQVLAMGRACAAESPRYRDKGWEDTKVEKLLKGIMAGDINHGLFVAENDEHQLVGMALGVIGTYFFSSERYATDLVVYVAPGLRGGITPIRLIKALEEWAQGAGVRELLLGVSTGINPEQAVCVYEKLGFKMAAQSLTKEV